MTTFNYDLAAADEALNRLPERIRGWYIPVFKSIDGKLRYLVCKHCYRRHGTGHDALCPYDRLT